MFPTKTVNQTRENKLSDVACKPEQGDGLSHVWFKWSSLGTVWFCNHVHANWSLKWVIAQILICFFKASSRNASQTLQCTRIVQTKKSAPCVILNTHTEEKEAIQMCERPEETGDDSISARLHTDGEGLEPISASVLLLWVRFFPNDIDLRLNEDWPSSHFKWLDGKNGTKWLTNC